MASTGPWPVRMVMASSWATVYSSMRIRARRALMARFTRPRHWASPVTPPAATATSATAAPAEAAKARPP